MYIITFVLYRLYYSLMWIHTNTRIHTYTYTVCAYTAMSLLLIYVPTFLHVFILIYTHTPYTPYIYSGWSAPHDMG